MQSGLKTLLITANVGSIFECPNELMPIWVEEVLKVVSHHKPHFLAIHFQELGGKDFKRSMCHLDKFLQLLVTNTVSGLSKTYSKYLIICDSNYSDINTFTALGNFYFVNDNFSKSIWLWNFQESRFDTFQKSLIFQGDLRETNSILKKKFPPEFYPGEKWSRKGFCMTRWRFHDGPPFDFANIHLFHDASNLLSLKSSPSFYSKCRNHALEYTISSIENSNLKLSRSEPKTGCLKDDLSREIPYFLFGDFNFRLDTRELVKILIEDSSTSAVMTTPKQPFKYEVSNEVLSAILDGNNISTIKKCRPRPRGPPTPTTEEFNHSSFGITASSAAASTANSPASASPNNITFNLSTALTLNSTNTLSLSTAYSSLQGRNRLNRLRSPPFSNPFTVAEQRRTTISTNTPHAGRTYHGFRIYNLDDYVNTAADTDTTTPPLLFSRGPTNIITRNTEQLSRISSQGTSSNSTVLAATPRTQGIQQQQPLAPRLTSPVFTTNLEDDPVDTLSVATTEAVRSVENLSSRTAIDIGPPKLPQRRAKNSGISTGFTELIGTQTQDNMAKICIDTKLFDVKPNHDDLFKYKPSNFWMLNLDLESVPFKNKLKENPIKFSPSYPYEEELSKPEQFMKTRCPGWCDRILYSDSTSNFLDDSNNIEYHLIGEKTCMGDHKPVYLSFTMKT